MGGFAGLGVVEAFAVNRGDFGAHAAQVTGELAAMVDAVVHADLHEGDGGEFEDAAEVGDFDEVLAFELRELFKIARQIFGIPGGDFGGSLDGLGQARGSGEFGVDGRFDRRGRELAGEPCWSSLLEALSIHSSVACSRLSS